MLVRSAREIGPPPPLPRAPSFVAILVSLRALARRPYVPPRSNLQHCSPSLAALYLSLFLSRDFLAYSLLPLSSDSSLPTSPLERATPAGGGRATSATLLRCIGANANANANARTRADVCAAPNRSRTRALRLELSDFPCTRDLGLYRRVSREISAAGKSTTLTKFRDCRIDRVDAKLS